ncbi:MAG: type II toxin-antitoxin system VapB family antitoxin [Bryobacteraceae bacterium]
MTAPIQIKRSDVAEDARELAALTGLSLTEAIAKAVRVQLAIERVKANKTRSKRRSEAERTLAELRSLPIVGPHLTDDDLYGPDGLPK